MIHVDVFTGDTAAGAAGCQTLCVCSGGTRSWEEPGSKYIYCYHCINEATYKIVFAHESLRIITIEGGRVNKEMNFIVLYLYEVIMRNLIFRKGTMDSDI